MKLSVKTDYACRAVAALASHQPSNRPMRIDEIARKQSIPTSYLVQILIGLKSKGLIKSWRGKAGGYGLAKPPREITMGDVIRAVHGEVIEVPMLADANCPDEIKRAWRRIKDAAEVAADGTTFEQICAEAKGRPEMYYI
jgi:Rrf2 family cysteine metabolism transcriptional repressor